MMENNKYLIVFFIYFRIIIQNGPSEFLNSTVLLIIIYTYNIEIQI